MKRPITDQERFAAQLEIDARKRAVRYLLQAFEARIRDETNDAGEVVIECTFVPIAPVERLEMPAGLRDEQ